MIQKKRTNPGRIVVPAGGFNKIRIKRKESGTLGDAGIRIIESQTGHYSSNTKPPR